MMSFLSASPDTVEKKFFSSSVYLCSSLATLLNFCMCERGNGLINGLKKVKDFSESLQQYFIKLINMVCKKAYEAWNHCFL